MADKIISTLQVEIYGDNNVRIGYLKKDPQITYKKAVYAIDYIDSATPPIDPTPLVPTEKDLALINDTIEYLAIYTSDEVAICLNGDPIQTIVNGEFVVSGSQITAVKIINSNLFEVKLEIVQGDEAV